MLKRVFDLLSALVGVLILLPILVVVACLVKLDSTGPVFYRQARVGRFGVLFRIHKFRTMTVNADINGRLTIGGSDPRITRVGYFLRKYKIDELPQLIDVICGQMSLVGPRPEVQEFVDCYPLNIKDKVLSIRPGITDKASIEMVDESDILAAYENPRQAYIDVILPIKLKYYVEYVDQQGFFTDLGIIFATFKKIIVR